MVKFRVSVRVSDRARVRFRLKVIARISLELGQG